MEVNELIKTAAVLGLYGIIAPALGLLMWRRPKLQRIAFVVVCFMIPGGILSAGEWGITLDFFLYRGHAKGYHFYIIDVPALALLIALALDNWRRVRLFPPGLWLYLLYCALSFLSIFNAPEPEYVVMALFKYVKLTLYFVLAYNFIRTEDDVHLVLRTLAAMIFWQLFVVLKMKYIDHRYQVAGTFEHQNSLSMFVTMLGMVYLAVGLGPPHPKANLYLLAFIACAAIQQSTLSRAGLVVFACATIVVCVYGLIEQVTKRRLVVLGALSAVGAVGLLMTMDTVLLRFNDYGTQSSGKTRELLNVASSRMLQDYPLGIGWNNFARTINKPFPYGRVIDDWEREGGVRVDEDAPKGIAESMYWLLLAEAGYQGLVAWVLFISVFLWKSFRAALAFRYQFLGAVSLGIFMGCLANYLQSFLERVLTQPRNVMLWMILLAVTARIGVWRREKRKESRPGNQQQRRRVREPQAAMARPSRV